MHWLSQKSISTHTFTTWHMRVEVSITLNKNYKNILYMTQNLGFVHWLSPCTLLHFSTWRDYNHTAVQVGATLSKNNKISTLHALVMHLITIFNMWQPRPVPYAVRIT
jgi:uncharacterized membrane protein YcfT